MVYNYSIHLGESFNIKTPGNHSFEDITKLIKSDGNIIINHSLYPDGFEIKITQIDTLQINITTNMELVKNEDGCYSIRKSQFASHL